ncbi:hypothetical protein RND81_07G056800 [Saponaria officinalis]|uniref:Amine oxidase domain-containing protein n=1 Tax=Saponaria officinalis TaxID=3572 RepID=A0AAW1JNE3_SAPOF
MVAKRPKIVIIGAGMAGITAAHKLYTTPGAKESFDLCVVEGGQRIGGRINTREFGGDRIEMGATWIHGIGGSPIYEIARKIESLESDQPWECMDGLHEDRVSNAETRIEGGFVVSSSIVEPISSLFENLMSFAQGKSEICDVGVSKMSNIGSFLKHGIENYFRSNEICEGDDNIYGDWSRKMVEEAVFAVYENTQRTYTGAGDLFSLDYAAESEYRMFPGDEITIPRGYISVVEALASVLPSDLIQLGRKVVKIEWQQNEHRPVKLHFSDGSVMQADHVIVTVSLGVLKAGISDEFGGLFSPSLPSVKKEAISRLGFGVVNKLFLELRAPKYKFPFMQMAFHRADSKFRDKKIPWWMRRTASIYPIHSNSNVLLSWFAGKEALELESLDNDTIIDGISTTVSNFIPKTVPSHENGSVNKLGFEIRNVLRSKWGNDPLFLGSYSYVSVGSSGDDFDSLAQPLPMQEECGIPQLQILFAGEATHRTHYSTTHGAYFSGLREANRLLQKYNLVVA